MFRFRAANTLFHDRDQPTWWMTDYGWYWREEACEWYQFILTVYDPSDEGQKTSEESAMTL